MEILVIVLMILVCFNFLLKQTFQNRLYVVLTAVVCALFVGLAWPSAIEQSRTQIGEWVSNQKLMLDISVLLSIEVLVQLAFCMVAAHVSFSGKLKKRTIVIYKILRWFPGLLIFPVLFGCLVSLIFSMPGQSFSLIAWSLSAFVCLVVPALSWLFRTLLEEKELRLELLFLSNALLAILGVVATVNGRTAVAGTTDVNWISSVGFIVLIVLLGSIGILRDRYKLKDRYKSKFNHH